MKEYSWGQIGMDMNEAFKEGFKLCKNKKEKKKLMEIYKTWYKNRPK